MSDIVRAWKETRDPVLEGLRDRIAELEAEKCADVTIIPPSGLSVGFVWQPIETAPMDGTEVILFYEHYLNEGLVTAGYFHVATDDYESHWYADLVNGGASPPTKWMPLPTPPERGDGQ